MALGYGLNLGLPKTKGIADLVYIEKSYKHYKILHFQACIFQDQPWNPPDFMDEICQISWWNLPDFMKFTRFHEICQISWYTTECCIFHQNQYRYTLWAYYMLNMQCISPCHEICQISWYTTECCIFHQNQYRYTLWAYYMLNMQCISPNAVFFIRTNTDIHYGPITC